MEKSGEREKSMMQERGETYRTLIRSRQEGADAYAQEPGFTRMFVPRRFMDGYFAHVIYNIVRNGHIFSQM